MRLQVSICFLQVQVHNRGTPMSADMFEQERARARAPLPNVHCSHERLRRHQHWVQQQDRQKESPGTYVVHYIQHAF